MTVIFTSARASVVAAFSPPKPAPTITTRCVCLPFIASLYKIQRDGNPLQKFWQRKS